MLVTFIDTNMKTIFIELPFGLIEAQTPSFVSLFQVPFRGLKGPIIVLQPTFKGPNTDIRPKLALVLAYLDYFKSFLGV